jgi:hypothetical protein
MKWIASALRAPVSLLLALVLLFEEWGWEPLAALLARLGRLPFLAWVERSIRRLPAWAALLVLLVPMVTLFPIKLLALYLFGAGHPAWGLALLLGAKVLGTAIVARLFNLTQPALMQIGWFARWYPRFKAWKDGWIEHIRASGPWQAGRRMKAAVRAWWQQL